MNRQLLLCIALVAAIALVYVGMLIRKGKCPKAETPVSDDKEKFYPYSNRKRVHWGPTTYDLNTLQSEDQTPTESVYVSQNRELGYGTYKYPLKHGEQPLGMFHP